MDFGQYSGKDVASRLKPREGKGVCERCGRKTKSKTMFGMTICNDCLNKQYKGNIKF